MLGSMVLFTMLIGAPLKGSCYVLYDAAGAPIYQGNEPPFSQALPPSAEAEASRARGEKLMIYTDSDCRRNVAAAAKTPAPRPVPKPPGIMAAPERPAAPVSGRVAGGTLYLAPGRPDGDPEAKAAYDPFGKGEIRGGLAAGLERVRRGIAEGRTERGVPLLDTATLAETEGKEAMQEAIREVAGFEGERADDAMYSCLLVDDPQNCIAGKSLALLLNRTMNPGTTAYGRQRARQTLALFNSYGFGQQVAGDALIRSQGLPSEGIAASPTDRMLADLLQRAIQGDQEALKTWLALQGKPPVQEDSHPGQDSLPPLREAQPPIEEKGGLQAGPPVPAPLSAPRLSVEEAERLATAEEKQRQKWWIFQFPLDRRRITERTLEILEQSAREPNPYKTRGEVFDAYRLGRISQEQALRYLQAMDGG